MRLVLKRDAGGCLGLKLQINLSKLCVGFIWQNGEAFVVYWYVAMKLRHCGLWLCLQTYDYTE